MVSREWTEHSRGATRPQANQALTSCRSVRKVHGMQTAAFNTMKRSYVSLAGIGVSGVLLLAGLAWATPAAAPGGKGTSILHYFVRKAMTNTGVAPGATGRVEAKQNQQGNAHNRQLDITLKGLTTNTTYWLLAVVADETNYTAVTDFMTDRKGAAALRYRKIGSSQGKALGKGKSPLPDVLDPLYDIRELAILNASTQTVLVADLTAPDSLQYLIKRALDNEGLEPVAAGSLQVKATVNKAEFRLAAINLSPNASYWLALNGGVVGTNASDAKGRWKLTTQLVNPLDVLAVRDVAVLDSTTNRVLSTELP